jgi:hypothetical protein
VIEHGGMIAFMRHDRAEQEVERRIDEVAAREMRRWQRTEEERGELGSYGATVTTRPLSGPLPMSSHHPSFAEPGRAWAGTRIRIANLLD